MIRRSVGLRKSRAFHVLEKAALVLALTASGCNLALGIEEARVDDRLSTMTRDTDSEAGATTEGLEVSSAGAADATAAQDDGGVGDDVTTPPTDAGSEASEDTSHQGHPAPPVPSASTGDSQTGADATDEQDVEAGASEPTLCDRYCDEITELCTGELEQYRDMRQCLTVCSLFPPGELTSEVNDNSVACRLRYAAKGRYASGTEHAAYCRQAGPGGDGRCGSNCEGYCTLMEGVCTTEATDLYRFENTPACMAACQALPTTSVAYSTSNVDLSDGNHVQCRLFHVTSAAMLDPDEHCEHAMGVTLCEPVD